MKLSEFKRHLDTVPAVNFVQPDGTFVPAHFHITEAGLITKHFIDCGGTIREDKAANFQVWVAGDNDHRLEPQKLKKIIAISEKLFGNDDPEIEIEYQTGTIGKYGLDSDGQNFLLIPKYTDCLAKENCGSPAVKPKISLSELQTSCCAPGSGCC